MTIGQGALRAILAAKDARALGEVQDDWLTDEEKGAYDFARQYQRRFRKLPGLDVMKENGFALPRGSGDLAYYMRRLTDRALWQSLVPDVQELTEAMKERNIDHVMAAVAALHSKRRHFADDKLVSNIGVEAAALINDVRNRGNYTNGISFGYETLDRETGGMRRSELVTLAARTNVGKSYLMLQGLNTAWRDGGIRPLVVSMEMHVRALTGRMLGMESGINPKFIRDRTLSTRGVQGLAETVTEFQLRPPLTFVSGHRLKYVEALEDIVNEVQPDAVYIDAGYLLKLKNRGKLGKWEMLEEVMEYVKGIADRSERGHYMTVQLGRTQKVNSSSIEDAMDKIRGSDAIGQLSDVTIAAAPAPGIHAETRRVLFLAKNREGRKNIKFWSKFEFTPRLDFSETPIERAGETDEQDENVRRMM